MIELENVSMTYPGGNQAHKNVNINIEKGEFVFIVGSSGSGKDHSVQASAQGARSYGGQYHCCRIRLWQDKEKRYTEGQKKDWSRIPELQASEGQDYIRECCICTESYPDSGEIHQKTCSGHADAGWTCRQIQIIPEGALSGGEQQRVAMARALVNNPDIILADEPTGNLDPKNSLDIMNLLEDINKRGTTVVVVTHNKDIVNEMKKRVITLKKGVIISDEKEGGYIDED